MPEYKELKDKRRTVLINGERFTANTDTLTKLHFVLTQSVYASGDYNADVGNMAYTLRDEQSDIFVVSRGNDPETGDINETEAKA